MVVRMRVIAREREDRRKDRQAGRGVYRDDNNNNSSNSSSHNSSDKAKQAMVTYPCCPNGKVEGEPPLCVVIEIQNSLLRCILQYR